MPSVSLKTQIPFNNPHALSRQLKHLGLTEKQWVHLAKQFEKNPANLTLEGGTIQTLDRKIVIQKNDLTKKPIFGSGLISFFLKAMQGKKYRQRMERLAIGLLDLMKKSQTSQLIQSNHKIEKIVISKPIVVKPVVERKPERPEPIFVKPRENERDVEEKQALSQLISEGSFLLISNQYEIQDLTRLCDRLEGQKFENGFDLNLFRECKSEVEEASLHYEKLQKGVDEGGRIKYPEPSIEQVKRARRDLDTSIKKLKEIAETYPQTKIKLNQISQKLSAAKTDAENKKNAGQQALRKEKQELTQLSYEGQSLLASYKAELQKIRQSQEELESQKFENGFDISLFWRCRNDADLILGQGEKLQKAVNDSQQVKYPEPSIEQVKSDRKGLDSSINKFKEAMRKIVQTQSGFDQIRQALSSAKAEVEQKKLVKEQAMLIANAVSEGNRLLSSHLIEIQGLREDFKKVEEEIGFVDRLTLSNRLDSAYNALQDLQKSMNLARGHLNTEAAVISARLNLESSISKLKEALHFLPRISHVVKEAQKSIQNKKIEQQRQRQAQEQAERQARQRKIQEQQDQRAQEAQRVRVEQHKMQEAARKAEAERAQAAAALQPLAVEDEFGDEELDTPLVEALFLGNLQSYLTIDNLLAKLELEYFGAAPNKGTCLRDVLKTIGLETLKHCKDKGIKDNASGDKYLADNKVAFKQLILQKHGNVVREKK